MKTKFKLKTIFAAAITATACLLTGCSKSNPGNAGLTLDFKDGDKIAEITIQDYGVIKAKLFDEIAPTAVKNFTELAENGYYEGLKIHRVAKDPTSKADLCIQGGSLNGDGTGGENMFNGRSFPNELSTDARHFYGALCTVNIDGNNTPQFYIVTSQMITDILQIDPAKIREKAEALTAEAETLEEYDPMIDTLTAQAEYYTNLADMMTKPAYDVQAKYADNGGYPLWDGLDTVFGQVFEGFDVINAICSAELTTASTGEVSKPVQDIVITSVVITEYVTPEPEEAEPESSKKKK